jgi:ribonuclease P protein component
MSSISHTFKKEERLKSRKVIKQLFSKGNSYAVYPLRLVWIPIEKETKYPVKFALTVAKKRIKKAVHRNRIRRKIRESWRLHKHILYEKIEEEPQAFAFMIIFSGKEEMGYAQIEQAMQTIIQRFPKKMRANQKKKN